MWEDHMRGFRGMKRCVLTPSLSSLLTLSAKATFTKRAVCQSIYLAMPRYPKEGLPYRVRSRIGEQQTRPTTGHLRSKVKRSKRSKQELPRVAPACSQSITHCITALPFFFFKMAQHLDLRCDLRPAPFVPGVPTQTRLESRIKKYNRHFVCRPLSKLSKLKVAKTTLGFNPEVRGFVWGVAGEKGHLRLLFALNIPGCNARGGRAFKVAINAGCVRIRTEPDASST